MPTYPPEVDNDWMVGIVVSSVRCVALPIVDINVLQTGQQQLQLIGVEYGK